MNPQHLVAPRRWFVLAAGLVAALLPVSGARLQAASPNHDGILASILRAIPAQIVGTIMIRGCAPSAGAIELIASPATFGAEGVREASPDPRESAPEARVMRTSNAHTFLFAIRGTRPHTMYRLAVGVTPASGCGRVFWRGPALGFVLSGATDVLIEGVAARTELEIVSATTREWAGADNLRFSEPGGGLRSLRWRSSLAGITAGELQISTDAFPYEGDFTPCEEPETGIVYRERLGSRGGEWADVSIDFGRILDPTRIVRDDRSSVETPAAGRVSASVYRMLLAGAPVYARVVPYRGGQPACNRGRDGVHGWVVLSQLPGGSGAAPDPPTAPAHIVAGDGHLYRPPQLGDGHPTYDEQAYKVIKPHKLPPVHCVGIIGHFLAKSDPLGCVIVNAGWLVPGATIQPGPWFYFTPEPPKSSGGGILSFLTGSFTFFITGAIDAAGFALDSAAKVWEDVKAAVVKLALNVLLAVPPGDAICGAIGSSGVTSCQGMVEAGLTIALASAGIPPSLPSWDQLKDEGLNYVAAQIATEMSPVPATVTEAALKELAKQAIDKMSANRGGSDPKTNWVIPYTGFEPASWTLVVKKPAAGLLPALWLNIPETPLFLGKHVPLPTVFPESGQLKIPVVLTPNLQAINAPFCTWGWRGANCFGVLPASASPVCFFESLNSGQSYYADCAQVPLLPGIYYRDAWVYGKLLTTACTDIKAWTQQDVGGIFFEPPDAYKMLVFGRLRPTDSLTWNGAFVATCGP